MRPAVRVLARFLGAEETQKPKRMILMLGPPAAGKGFFIGEPPKDGPPPNYGHKLPQMLVNDKGEPLLSYDDIPEHPEHDESDNHLKAIQFDEAKKHFEVLKRAHDKGQDAFDKALADHWYETKDGERVGLDRTINFANFERIADAIDLYKKANTEFYVSMRGWHDDAKELNKVTGKPKERYKDEARHRFDESVARKTDKAGDLLIVDSAGEDIDAQDFKGQIEDAKAHGYEVTVIFLHPEEADTNLSNLARGKVQGKRMVDRSDISNWYQNNEAALREIQKANPDNFLHYRKGPPDPDPKKAAQLRAKARDTMNRLASMPDEEREAAKQEVNKVLYGAANYKLNPETSYGRRLSGLPRKPQKNVVDTVKTMNEEAAKRADTDAPMETAAPKPKPEEQPKEKPIEHEEHEKTRMNFLRDRGDEKVRNPNPESRERFPKIKIRSLPWQYQKPYYEQWQARQASLRIVARYRGSHEE
jgi:hypothetical protein